MLSRDWFWFLAGVLVTVAVSVAVRALARERPAQTVRSAIPAYAVPVAAALGLIGVALGIYFLLGSPDSIANANTGTDVTMPASNATTSTQMGQSSTNAGSLDEVTQKLATRLATQGGSDNEWQLLAQSYDYMGRTADAKAARAHVASAPPSGAEGTRRDDSARDAAPAGLDGQTMAAVAGALDNGSGRANAPPIRDAKVSGTVELAPKLASRAPAGATLFIYAKQPNTPGPPLAVVRLRADHWPITFALSDANAMVPGRNLSTAQTVQIEARISRNGDALPQSGDLVGSVTSVNPRGTGPVKISIDREIG